MTKWKDVDIYDYVEVVILDDGHKWNRTTACGNIVKRFEDGTMQLDSKDQDGNYYEVNYGDTLLEHRKAE